LHTELSSQCSQSATYTLYNVLHMLRVALTMLNYKNEHLSLSFIMVVLILRYLELNAKVYATNQENYTNLYSNQYVFTHRHSVVFSSRRCSKNNTHFVLHLDRFTSVRCTCSLTRDTYIHTLDLLLYMLCGFHNGYGFGYKL